MKIVDRKTFLSLPENVVFSKFSPNVFEELQIKGETLTGVGDFYASDIGSDASRVDDWREAFTNAKSEGMSLPMDFESICRDGCFDEDQLFAVWEKADIEGLIERLKKCVSN